MSPELLQIFAQLGIGSVLLYLLLEERKARRALEDRVFDYLDKEQRETREIVKEATQPRKATLLRK